MAALALLATVLTLHAGANGHRFTVQPHTTVVVVLPSTPDGGYYWRLAAPLHHGVLRLLSHHYTGPGGKHVGGSGTETWRFRAVGKGLARLRMAYGQGPKNVARRFHVTINVR